MSRYRFALRPRWIASHLFVGALVAAMVTAGIWQLDRMAERRDRNAVVEARTAEPLLDAVELPAPGAFDAADPVEYRRVTATGRYLLDDEVLVRSRSNDGSPGSWVLTPLLLADGTAVTVNRGWIPNSGQLDAVPDAVTAPPGEVTVEGLVRLAETRGSIGPTDPDEGRLGSLARADIARFDQQVEAELRPLYVQLADQAPAVADGAPSPVPAPELDGGPHLSYAVQWFIFTTVAAVGYPLILRRRAGELERGDPDDAWPVRGGPAGGGAAPPDPLDRPDPADEPLPGDPRLEVDRGPA